MDHRQSRSMSDSLIEARRPVNPVSCWAHSPVDRAEV
jgi:hypothetical protein